MLAGATKEMGSRRSEPGDQRGARAAGRGWQEGRAER